MSRPLASKVIIDGDTIIDLTADNVSSYTLLSGVTAHDRTGAIIHGTIIERQAQDIVVHDSVIAIPAGATCIKNSAVTFPSGKYSENVTVSFLFEFASIVNNNQNSLVDNKGNTIGATMFVPSITTAQ